MKHPSTASETPPDLEPAPGDGDGGSGSVVLPLVDFLLLTLVTVLFIQRNSTRVHALEFETPAVSGSGFEIVSDSDELVLDVPENGSLRAGGQPISLEDVVSWIEKEPTRIRLRVAGGTRTDHILEFLSHLRPAAESVQVEVQPHGGTR